MTKRYKVMMENIHLTGTLKPKNVLIIVVG